MKILFYRYNSICEPDLIETFRGFGLTVVEETAEMTNKSLTGADRIGLLKRRFDECAPDAPFLFVFSVNYFPAVSEICRLYNIPYVCWSVDSPLAEIYSDTVKNTCNRLFLFDRSQYDDLHALHPDCIFHLPLCTNPERLQKVITTTTDRDRERFTADISFVGSLYTEKDPWLFEKPLPDYIKGFAEGLVSAQLSLVGCSFLSEALTDEAARIITEKNPETFAPKEGCVMNMDRYVAGEHILGMHASSLFRIRTLKALSANFELDLYTGSNLPDELKNPSLHLRGTANTLTEMPKIFHLSRINLNMTIYPLRSGLSLRIWDVLGCGGFLLTNEQEELRDHFVPGQDLDTFSCEEELIEKCAFYLSHEDIREKIARSGYEKVRDHHTYKNRFEQMLRHIT